ncbi:unnamed protein product [Symbiodinium pilosum]|uniref:Uncharacterized protein n=1 Tax=Symbiodinium pilosum TaxID=2952 RepID=A0A812T2B2_SYMPI|nr:unnamed protein product [Symbiodinium pilosum]
MFVDAETKWAEAKVAHAVRRAIQKIRVCTPENRETLEAEMVQTLSSREVELGSLLDQVRLECDRALEIADKRVTYVQQQRQEEEEKMRKPKEALEELEQMLASFRQSCLEFEEQIAEEGTVSPEQVSAAEGRFEEFNSKAKKFRDELKEFVAQHSKEFQNQKLPLAIRQGWLEQVRTCAMASKEADELIEKGRTAVTEAKTLAKKELLTAAKTRLDEELREAPAAFAKAQQLVMVCEEKVQPFVGIPQGKDEHQMQSIAKELDNMVGSASEGVVSARSTLSSQTANVEVADEIKEDIEQYMQDQTKRLRIRLGQLDRRILRVRNLVCNYQKDLQKEKSGKIIRDLKAKALDSIEDSKVQEKAEEAEAAIKEAERKSEKLKAMDTLPLPELQARAVSTSLQNSETVYGSAEDGLQQVEAGLVKAAKETLDSVTNMLCPLQDWGIAVCIIPQDAQVAAATSDKDVDDDVRVTLCKHVLSKKSRVLDASAPVTVVRRAVFFSQVSRPEEQAAFSGAAGEEGVQRG